MTGPRVLRYLGIPSLSSHKSLQVLVFERVGEAWYTVLDPVQIVVIVAAIGYQRPVEDCRVS